MSTPHSLLVVTPAAQLTSLDRCDRCGAEARTIAVKPNSQPLLFCGHHARSNGIALLEQGWQLHHKES